MTKYVLDAVFAVIALIIIIQCAKRGLFKTVMKFARLILAAVAAYLFGSKVATFLADKFFSARIYTAVYNKIESIYQSATDGFDAQKILAAFPSFLVPESMKEQISSMDETGEALVLSASDTLSGALTKIVSTVVGYVLVFIVALIVLAIVSAIIGAIIKRLALIGTVDHVLGAVIGVAVAWVVLTLLSSVIRFFFSESDFYTQSHAVRLIAESPVSEKLAFLNLDGLLSKAFNR